ncbi:MFS transporter [Georgenia sp. EYE_87]|uniref:MFS transporter n=1 Tax=Georgenia sp. EYE_87 TaxID=2853448 RepID=UPI00200651B3|nr:MFS transporter [Georgenia sp. EYE_87]MCK6211617.1 MFS transporter [Georgenia sp. EYE_87]
MTQETLAVAAPPQDRNDARTPGRSTQKRTAVVSGAIGSALEWFDFAVYGALSATIFPALFFSDLGAAGGLIASFATFGVGFFARPLGAVVCGHLGDKYGRRPVLLGTFILMGVSSLAIGALPANQGVTIAAVLVALRFLQGFSLGGEATGAQLMILEHANANQRGFLGAFINIGSPLSQVLANVTLVVLSSSLSETAFMSWGWRVPFLMSILLVLVGIFIRLRLEETPVFVEHKAVSTKSVSGLQVLRSRPGTIAKLMLVRAGSNVTFYTMAVYGLNYLTTSAGFAQSQAFVIVLVANGVSVLFGLLGGRVSDRIGRRPVLVTAIFAQILAVVCFFPAAATGNVLLVTATVAVAISGVQFEFGSQPALYAEEFPTNMRFSGSALSLSFSQLLFSAPAPMIAAALASTGNFWAIAAVNVGVLLLSLVFVRWVRENHRAELNEIG